MSEQAKNPNLPGQYHYRIYKIEVENFYVNDLEKDSNGDYPDFTYRTNLNVGFWPDEEIFEVIIRMSFRKKDGEEEFGKADIKVKFKIIDLKNYLTFNEENQPIGIDTAIIENCLRISFSTTRGVLYGRGVGTVLEHKLFPIQNEKKYLRIEEEN